MLFHSTTVYADGLLSVKLIWIMYNFMIISSDKVYVVPILDVYVHMILWVSRPTFLLGNNFEIHR